MKNNRFARMMLVADLAVCCLLLLCISHELYFVPLLAMVLTIRMWLGFSAYHRSRTAICPIVLLAAMTVYIWADPYGLSYELFLMPWITLARGALSLFGADRTAADAVIGRLLAGGWSMKQIVSVAAAAGSMWLLVLPAVMYICRAVKRQLQPGRLSLEKNIGLCAYLLGISILLEVSPCSCNESAGAFLLALLLVPLLFNSGKVDRLLSRGEIAFIGTLAISAAAYICGVGMEEKSIITASLLPAAFYALVNWWLRCEIPYPDIVCIVFGSAAFAWAQYESGALRQQELFIAALATAIVAIRFAIKSRKYLTSAGLFIMMTWIIPILCIGYNPYTVLEAKRVEVCHDYSRAHNGLLYVQGRNGKGIRDRFGIILPAGYSQIQILQHWMPYFKVGDEGAWKIYDIERHTFVSDECFEDILPYNDTAFVLKHKAGNSYLILPEHYDRMAKSQQAVISDCAPAEK